MKPVRILNGISPADRDRAIVSTINKNSAPITAARGSVSFVLSLSFRIVEHNNQVHNGDWVKCKDYSFKQIVSRTDSSDEQTKYFLRWVVKPE